MAGVDMITRILKMYESLSRGREIQKIPFCMENEISERTFDRDIEKIRMFLSEEYSGKEVQYNLERDSYRMSGNREHGELSVLEMEIIIKILKGEQALEKHEFEGLIRSLQSVVRKNSKENILAFIQKESSQYKERAGQKAFLKMFGDLQECIADRNIIRMSIKGEWEEQKKIKFIPVAVEYWASEFYLLGYEAEEKRGLTVFILSEIESFQVTSQRYEKKIAELYSYQEAKCLLKSLHEKRREENETY